MVFNLKKALLFVFVLAVGQGLSASDQSPRESSTYRSWKAASAAYEKIKDMSYLERVTGLPAHKISTEVITTWQKEVDRHNQRVDRAARSYDRWPDGMPRSERYAAQWAYFKAHPFRTLSGPLTAAGTLLVAWESLRALYYIAKTPYDAYLNSRVIFPRIPAQPYFSCLKQSARTNGQELWSGSLVIQGLEKVKHGATWLRSLFAVKKEVSEREKAFQDFERVAAAVTGGNSSRAAKKLTAARRAS